MRASGDRRATHADGPAGSSLTEQLDSIEGAVADQLSSQPEADHGVSEQAEALAALQREFAEAKTAWDREREQLIAMQMAARMQAPSGKPS